MKCKMALMFSAIFISCLMYAQTPITINVSDVADGGDIFVVSTGNAFEDYELDYTGANVTWDYSFLSPVTQDSIVWVDATDTNPLYFLLWFSSDVAEETGVDFESDFFSIEDIYNFYDRSSSRLAITGFAGTITGIPIPAIYDDADVVYAFPLTYENEYSSNSGFTISIPGFGSWTETKTRTCEVDGWGTVITPFGEFETVRVHCVLEINDVFEYSGFEIPISYTTHEYRWLAQDMGIPVIQINTQEFLGFETVTAVTYQDTLILEPVSVEQMMGDVNISIQNPVNENLLITVQSEKTYPMQIQLKDIHGALVLETEKEMVGNAKNTFSYSTAHLQNGMYIANIVMDNQIVSAQKLVVIK